MPAAPADESTPLSARPVSDGGPSSSVALHEIVRRADREIRALRVACLVAVAFGVASSAALLGVLTPVGLRNGEGGGSLTSQEGPGMEPGAFGGRNGETGEDSGSLVAYSDDVSHSGDVRSSIFNELTAEEARKAAEFFCRKMQCAPYFMPNGQDYLSGPSSVELYLPEKEAALRFIDHATKYAPPRFAKVTLVRPKMRDVMEYIIGPIGSSKQNITALTQSGQIPFEKRPIDFTEDYNELVKSIFMENEALRDLFIQSFGNILNFLPGWEKSEGKLIWFSRADVTSTNTRRIGRLQFLWMNAEDKKYSPGSWLNPVPFGFRVDERDANPSMWKVFDFVYCGQGPFDNIEILLRKAEHCKVQNYANFTRNHWDVPTGKQESERSPPITTSPNGKRYAIKKGNIEWMEWKFQATQHPSTGPALYDVRFEGARILYELSLQEAHASYGGSAMEQFYYPDSAFSLSILSSSLKKGIDCPLEATYLPALTYSDVFGRLNVTKARMIYPICVFEQDKATTLWRHTNTKNAKVMGVRDTQLVVRSIATVGNYDYISSFRFSRDGTIEVTSEYAGFCETRWVHPQYNDWETPFGTTYHTNLSAPVHSHLVNFKADFDVFGTQNSFVKTSVEVEVAPVDHRAGLSSHEKAQFANKMLATKVMRTRQISKEGPEATAVVNARKPSVWRIVNTDKRTPSGGDFRGYAIVPMRTNVQVLPDSHPFVKASAYTKYNLVVTKRKESERRVSSVYDGYGAANPTVSLDWYMDGDSLDQVDLVAWITVGKEHITRTEDLPLVSNFGSGFLLQPWNYFDRNGALCKQRKEGGCPF